MSNYFSGYRLGITFQFLTATLVLTITVVLSGCATTGGTDANVEGSPDDPYENINRQVFAFNDKVDDYVAEPISNAYKWVMPEFMQTGVSNFFNNLKNIDVILNDLLQAKFDQGAQDTGRLLINTTAGVGGLFDVAKHAGFEQNDEDFEQTLAVWGVPQGSYLVIPFLGPSTARGIPGTIFDTAANPVIYVGWPAQLVSMLSMLNSRANADGALKFIDEAALDRYLFTRDSFLQWRNSLATDGRAEEMSDLADFEDDLFDDAPKSPDAGGPHAEFGDGTKSKEVKNAHQDAANQYVPPIQDAAGAAKSARSTTAEPVKNTEGIPVSK